MLKPVPIKPYFARFWDVQLGREVSLESIFYITIKALLKRELVQHAWAFESGRTVSTVNLQYQAVQRNLDSRQ